MIIIQFEIILEGADFMEPIRLKIGGGSISEPSAFPWHALIYIILEGEEKVCSGALIGQKWVVTAAHCVRNFDKVEVILGEVDRSKQDKTEQRFFAKEVISHPLFNPKEKVVKFEHKIKGFSFSEFLEFYKFYKDLDLEHDVALILLNDHAWLNNNIREICLSTEAPKLTADCVLTGFGYTEEEDDNSLFLRHGKLGFIFS